MSSENDTFSVLDFFKVLFKRKLLIVIVTILFSAIGVFYSLSLPNLYYSVVKLYPSEESRGGGLNTLASQFGSLANIAGLRLPSATTDKSGLAIEMAQSYNFITEFINKRGLLPDLLAVEKWDPATTSITYDKSVFNPDDGTWHRTIANKPAKPTDWEAYDHFKKQVLRISVDDKKGIVTVGIRHVSPQVAKQWAEWFVTDINETMRTLDIQEATRSKTYLEEEVRNSQISSAQQVLFNLIEKQIQTLMLANVREEYVFKTLSQAYLPEEKSAPNRAVICILFFLAGFILSSFCAVFYETIRK